MKTSCWLGVVESQLWLEKPSGDVSFRRCMDEDDDCVPSTLCRVSRGSNGESVYFRCWELDDVVRITVQYEEPYRNYAVLKSRTIAKLLNKSFLECNRKLLTLEKQVDELSGRLVVLHLNAHNPPLYPSQILAAVSGTSPESHGRVFFTKVDHQAMVFMEGLFGAPVDSISEMVSSDYRISDVTRLC